MKYQITFHPEATKEYLEACNWYEHELTGLGKRFKSAMLRQADLILNDPQIYPLKRKNYRESVIQDFPYILVYSVNHQKEIITISAIYHTSRNPKKKYRK